MKKSLLPCLLMLMLLSVFACKNDDDNPPATIKEINVTVKDESARPYPKTRVTIIQGTTAINTGLTDEEGSYALAANTDGTYKIIIIPPLSTTIVSADTISLEVKTGTAKTANFVLRNQTLPALTVIDSIDIFGEIKNENGMEPTDPGELIYAKNVFDPPLGLLTAIKAPDGDHLNLAEWKMAQGNVQVHCDGKSSSANISLEGLIPEGTYTFWLNFLKTKKTAGQTISFGNDVDRIEPLGSGELNIQKASTTGTINATINHPFCILTESAGLVLVVVYHLNGKTFGAAHIPDEEEVNQQLIYFQ